MNVLPPEVSASGLIKHYKLIAERLGKNRRAPIVHAEIIVQRPPPVIVTAIPVIVPLLLDLLPADRPNPFDIDPKDPHTPIYLRVCAVLYMMRNFQQAVHITRIGFLARNHARMFNISYVEMLGKRRMGHIVRPRQYCMGIAYHLKFGTLPAIGRFFDKDHTTVLHAVKVTKEVIAAAVEHFDACVGTPARLQS